MFNSRHLLHTFVFSNITRESITFFRLDENIYIIFVIKFLQTVLFLPPYYIHTYIFLCRIYFS